MNPETRLRVEDQESYSGAEDESGAGAGAPDPKDFLSALPDGILDKVLGHLTMAEAARNAYLGSRFCRHWLSLPEVDFTSVPVPPWLSPTASKLRISRKKFSLMPRMDHFWCLMSTRQDCISRCLNSPRRLGGNLRSLRFNAITTPRILDRISEAVSHLQIQYLDMKIMTLDDMRLPAPLISSPSLNQLRLTNLYRATILPSICPTGFPNLKQLEIKNFTSEAHCFAADNFPSLEKLRLSKNGSLQQMSISGTNLKELSITEIPILEDLEVIGPNLENLKVARSFGGKWPEGRLNVVSPNLMKLIWESSIVPSHVSVLFQHTLSEASLLIQKDDGSLVYDRIFRLLLQVANVRLLRLNNPVIKAFQPPTQIVALIFPFLHDLELRTMLDTNIIPRIPILLKHCPTIRRLTISDPHSDCVENDEVKRWDSVGLEQDWMEHCSDEVLRFEQATLQGTLESPGIQGTAKFFLQHNQRLRLLTIHVEECLFAVNDPTLREKLGDLAAETDKVIVFE